MTAQIAVKIGYPRLRMLSDEQVWAIHQTSLDILARTGIMMKHEGARHAVPEAGAWESDGRVKIPPHLILDALSTAPSRIPMHNRLWELALPLEEGRVFFGPGSDCPFTIDIETCERRAGLADDVRRISFPCDGLDQIDFVMSMAVAFDVPALDHSLMDEHTHQHMRSQLYHPPVADRSNRITWDATARPDTRAQAIQRARW